MPGSGPTPFFLISPSVLALITLRYHPGICYLLLSSVFPTGTNVKLYENRNCGHLARHGSLASLLAPGTQEVL